MLADRREKERIIFFFSGDLRFSVFVYYQINRPFPVSLFVGLDVYIHLHLFCWYQLSKIIAVPQLR